MRMKTTALAAVLLLASAAAAQARVEMPARGAIAMGMGEVQVFGDAMAYASTTMTTATAEAIIRDQIAEAHAAGVRMFWYDGKNNGATTRWRAARWNAAARSFNAANPTAPVCIIPGYRTADAGDGTTTGALPMFDAIDAGASASPLCTKGGKPVVAIIAGATCINPLTVISARGPFVVLYGHEVDPWVPPQACVTAIKGAGASFVYAAITAATSFPVLSSAASVTATQAAATAAGADGYILGIGNARSSACGVGGNGAYTGSVSMTDMNYWQHFLAGNREAVTRAIDYVVHAAGFSGDTPRGSYVTGARVCDPRDRVAHNVDSGGVNRGFSCPNVPDDFKAAIPAGFDRSLSLPYWTRPGLVEAAKIFNAWVATGTEPSTVTPFVGFMYRQHRLNLAGTWQVCPGANYLLTGESISGIYHGDHVALTSWAATPTRVRVKLAGETLFDGTLPAKQMALPDPAQAQTKVAIGARVGRPIIEVLNATGDVVASKEGLLKITDTPKHWNGQTGRNLGLYADLVPFSSDIGFRGISLGTTGDITSNLVDGIAGIGIETRGIADDVDIVGNTVAGAKIGIGLGSTAGAGRGRSMATVNNIVVNSTAMGIGASGEVAGDAVYANNLLHGNVQAMQPSIAAVAAGTITAAPLFVGAADFRLQSGSPARGAGLAAYATGSDRDGRPRKVPPDVGAYEFFDPTARNPCEEAGAPPADPCAPGGASYPCSTAPAVGACIPAPTLSSPTNISVGANGGTWSLGRDEDAMVTCQDVVVGKTITIIGGNKVHVRGCEVVLGWDVAAALNREALKLVGMREAYVEGSIFDANDRCDAVTVALKGSGIAYDNSATKLTLVNVWTGNNNYNVLDGACAGNCVDTQGEGQTGQLDIYADRLTCVSKGEGIFVPDRQVTGDNIVDLKRTNVRFGPNGVPRFNVYRDGALLHTYFSGWEGMNDNIHVRLDDVWSDWTQSNRNVGPGPATGDAAAVDFTDPALIKFKGANFTGTIRKGVPAAGDFAPRSKLGRAYSRAEFCSNAQGVQASLIPYSQPAQETLQSSPKKVLAHWHQFPLSRNKTGPDGDWYSSAANLRLRPLPRPARTSSGDVEWRVEDAAIDIKRARQAGIDAFLVNMYRHDMTNVWAWPQFPRMLTAAGREGGGFKVAPNFDCTYGGDAAAGTAMANQYVDHLETNGKSGDPNLMKVGSSYLVGTYWANNCQAAHYSSFKARMAERGMPVYLLCTMQGGPKYVAGHDGVCDAWSDWGERSADQAASINWETRFAGVSSTEPIAGVISQGDVRYPTAGDWWTAEQRGFGSLRNSWTSARTTGADWVQLHTWNDIGEHSEMYPTTTGQWAFYDLNAYYIAWFKTGVQPTINKDAIYYSHRIAQTPVGTKMQIRHLPWYNEIDVVAFLTAPATVEVVTSAGTTSQSLGAGLQTMTAPLPTSGKPRIRVIRGGQTVVDVESQFTVGAMPAEHDVIYRAGGSLRTAYGATNPAATVCATGTPDDCLMAPGEPVWRKE